MRFAFYGRVSTEDQQDPQSSKAWQLSRARSLIEPAGGEVVAEFFDIGLSRSLPWKRRPEAQRLLDAIKSPAREFEAVVIGEPQRAFYGNQFGLTFPVFVHYGVELWVPEVGGAVDPGTDAHDLVMALYGGMSKGERNRIKIRVRSAMKAQTELEGRFLGGRPPYGYRLADAGPHPNPGKAAEGKRLHRLEPDPVTAPVVERIFAEYVAGRGMTSIARGLTARRHRLPVGVRPGPQPAPQHARSGRRRAVRAILQQPALHRPAGLEQAAHRRGPDRRRGRRARPREPAPLERPERSGSGRRTEAHTPLITHRPLRARPADRSRARGTRGDAGKAPRRSRPPVPVPRPARAAACASARMVGSLNHGRIYYRCTATPRLRPPARHRPPAARSTSARTSIADPVDRFLHEELGRAHA